MAIMTAPAVRAVQRGEASLGEGPVWVASEGALYWLDIHGRRILAYRPDDGSCRQWHCSLRITAIAPCTSGGFIAGTERGFIRLTGLPGDCIRLGNPEPDLPGNRGNDGKTDPFGHFWLGTMDDAEEQRSGALYRLDPDLAWHRMADGYGVPNGPAFSPDGRWLYHTDSAERTIWRFALSADGCLADRQVFARFDERHGYPDGMTTDAEGHLWVAFWDGWCLRRFTPSGEQVDELPLPVQRPTSCAFGGVALDRLFVTSARVGLSPEALAAQPDAGSLFACEVAVPGLAPTLFPA